MENETKIGKIEYSIRMIGPLNEKTMTVQMKRNWERIREGSRTRVENYLDPLSSISSASECS